MVGVVMKTNQNNAETRYLLTILKPHPLINILMYLEKLLTLQNIVQTQKIKVKTLH
jgi:hypothetical protein